MPALHLPSTKPPKKLMKAPKNTVANKDSSRSAGILSRTIEPSGGISALLILLILSATPFFPLRAQQPPSQEAAPRMTGRYHFLGPEDVLAVLEEEGIVKGYIDVYEGENESDAILSYQIMIGSRKGNHVQFRTRKIHEKYYRFSGNVERGAGKKPGSPDYLQLSGILETVTENSVTGEQKVQKQQVVLKSFGKDERPPEPTC